MWNCNTVLLKICNNYLTYLCWLLRRAEVKHNLHLFMPFLFSTTYITYKPSNLCCSFFQFLGQSTSLLFLGCSLTCTLIKSHIFNLQKVINFCTAHSFICSIKMPCKIKYITLLPFVTSNPCKFPDNFISSHFYICKFIPLQWSLWNVFTLTSSDSRNLTSSLCRLWFSFSRLSTFAWLVLNWVWSSGTCWASDFQVSACWMATSFVLSNSSARRWILSTRHCNLCFSFVMLSTTLPSSSIWDLPAFIKIQETLQINRNVILKWYQNCYSHISSFVWLLL